MKSDTDQDQVFQALAHADRRRILDLVRADPGCTVKALARQFDVSRVAILKQLSVLERAQLIVSEKVGRERHLYFNVVPIQQIYDRWTDEYSTVWASHLQQLKQRIENR